ncbi:hypothetical protein BCR44DRAFT_77693 [Catenaria anguillulae PL171]|uniref:Uncharacterized protein n=1 Tax=Catenaria anguillulae PL171 TaxID=765915 RepID=A0A1Y2HYN9_9FUNG|nr:hypothetical protein BCR44DRAFT_77693 [Catenaria anguillulae PL171]
MFIGFTWEQYCDNGRCMPDSCRRSIAEGCQRFDKRTYCPADFRKCAPRLEAGQACRWDPGYNEQPCAPGLVCSGLARRSARSKPRLPTVQDSIPGQALVVLPPPKPTDGPAASPAPRPSKSSESPLEQLAEHATTSGQTKTVIEVPLQPLASSNPQAYPPQSPAQMPMPQAHAPPFDSQPDVRMPAPQVLSLNGSTLHSQLSSDLPDPPQPSPAQPAQPHPSSSRIQAQSQADQATLSSGPGGVQIEVAAGPGDSELALPGGDQYSTRVQVHGNPEDEELVLPGLTTHAAARE